MTRVNGKSPKKPKDDGEKSKLARVPEFDVAPEQPPAHMIVGSEFIAQTELGPFVMSLRVKERTIRLMEGLPLPQQFEVAVAELAPQWAEQLPELDHIDLVVLRSRWIQALLQWQDARLGESFGSSTS